MGRRGRRERGGEDEWEGGEKEKLPFVTCTCMYLNPKLPFHSPSPRQYGNQTSFCRHTWISSEEEREKEREEERRNAITLYVSILFIQQMTTSSSDPKHLILKTATAIYVSRGPIAHGNYVSTSHYTTHIHVHGHC